MQVTYTGEHTWAGATGHFFVILSFTAAILAAASYFMASGNTLEETGWKRLGRIAFRTHSLAVLGIMSTLFIMLKSHFFEYQYVWQHSNLAMPAKYIFSCFWEGQEGSFLLWTFWHVVLGNILIRYADKWEAPVMTVFSFVQIFLACMLLGIYAGPLHFGSNPFLLMRQMPENIGMPWTTVSDYLQKIPLFQDGRGLNPLLQNYWMTIHPPTLFLGFASTLVPFAYAIAGLWKGKLDEWQKPALPWTFFGIMILGTGILMGGAWAYEALTFGGFWAWDPVENASLVPWLTFVGAGHVMLVNKHRKISIFSTLFLIIVTFLLVLYSTFLTRSGILGDSSVHAFTDLGMKGLLMLYLLFFVWMSMCLLMRNKRMQLIYSGLSFLLFVFAVYSGVKTASVFIFSLLSLLMLILSYTRYFPKEEKEEALWSREFWMFIGAIILAIASFQIILYTSFPVLNKIIQIDFIHHSVEWLHAKMQSWFHYNGLANFASGKLAPERNAIGFYNKWQSVFAALIGILVGFGQYLKYKDTPFREFSKKLRLPFLISIGIAILIGYGLPRTGTLQYFLNEFLLFSCLFCITSNVKYWISVGKLKFSRSGSSIAHIGFGLILLGCLISNAEKEIISRNSGMDLKFIDKELSNSNNILLTQGDTVAMGSYSLTYTGRKKEGIHIYFNVEYLKKLENGKYASAFVLQPFVQLNKQMGNVAEPATEHFLHKDIYTHVKFAELDTPEESNNQDFTAPINKEMARFDTAYSSNSMLILDSLTTHFNRQRYGLADTIPAVQANLRLIDVNKKVYYGQPVFSIVNNKVHSIDDTVKALGIRLTFWNVDPTKGKISLYLSEKKSNKRDFIVMEAMIFPWINVLWIGCLVMILGTVLAIRERLRSQKGKQRGPEAG
ncbi:MAG: cytochrome c biogenesis protein CcsA [Bacteroidia bacterium]